MGLVYGREGCRKEAADRRERERERERQGESEGAKRKSEIEGVGGMGG